MKGKTIEELRTEWDERDMWEKEHPVRAFIYNIPDFFRYRIPRYIDDAYYSAKWGLQRMFREYDDPYVWSFYHEHGRITLAALKKLKEIKHGSCWIDDPDDVLTHKIIDGAVDSNIHERYEEALDIIIRGFEAQQEMDDVHILDENGKYDVEANRKKCDELDEEWKKGMKLFVHNYRGFWD